MKNRIIYTLFLCVVAFTSQAQYNVGQFGVGGAFSFVNSRNTSSRSTTDFNDNQTNGINTGLIAGKFLASKNYVYGVVDIEYTRFKRDLITDNIRGTNEQNLFSSSFTIQAGIGVRRYYAVNEKNIIGFFLQGQLQVGNTWVNQSNFAAQNDTVFQDTKLNYPVRILSANINPGVYVNITPQWQLTMNIGNLYYTRTVIPEFASVDIPRRNSSFGLDVNIFDFRLGVLYTPRRSTN